MKINAELLSDFSLKENQLTVIFHYRFFSDLISLVSFIHHSAYKVSKITNACQHLFNSSIVICM